MRSGRGFSSGVVGCGYVGLVTGACLSHLGHRVTCVDKGERRIRGFQEGRIHFYEPGLEELLSESASRLRFGTELEGMVHEADAISRERPLLVVNKSTVRVGSGGYVSMLIREGLEEEKGRSFVGGGFSSYAFSGGLKP